MTRPYYVTIEDALFLHEAGESLHTILTRLGISRDGLHKAFVRTGTPEPVWQVIV